MSFANEKVTFYVFNDLRARQNNSFPEGNNVSRFDNLADAICEFNRLPKEWTTALGINVPGASEIDLVQRREGEPVLSGDYQRMPVYYNDIVVRKAVATLIDLLNIEWQSDYRVFGAHSVMFPIVPNMDFIRDRAFNGKHLCPDNSRHLVTAIQEIYTPDNGWQPLAKVWDEAEKFGYDCPHVPKITTLNVRYADERGRVSEGDMSPYNFILLMERTKIMENDKAAIKRLAAAVEEFVSCKDMKCYYEIFGKSDRLAQAEPGSFLRVRDMNVEKAVKLIENRNLAPLLEPLVSIAERNCFTPENRSDTRELLGRILNIPEIPEKKLPLDLRMRANTVMEKFYRSADLQKSTEHAKTHEEGR